ncbi:hypothetical protein C8Q74DRAFT_1367567 [Fomes fomentarius]|nr:hypothetical protein C8Q74DRAFT_1367567 [Fomes fomentarius]
MSDTLDPATLYTPWGSDGAELLSSAVPSPAVTEVKAKPRLCGFDTGDGPVRRDGLGAYPKRESATCSRASTPFPDAHPTTNTTTTTGPHLLSTSTTFYTSAYIAACLFASHRGQPLNHSILPIGATPSPKSTTKPQLSTLSPVREALSLYITMSHAPSLQPGTAEEERMRRQPAKSSQEDTHMSTKSVRRGNISGGATSPNSTPFSSQSLSSNKLPDNNARRNYERPPETRPPLRPLAPSGQTHPKAETVKCTVTPLDWPHPNSMAVPCYMLSPSRSTSSEVSPSQDSHATGRSKRPEDMTRPTTRARSSSNGPTDSLHPRTLPRPCDSSPSYSEQQSPDTRDTRSTAVSVVPRSSNAHSSRDRQLSRAETIERIKATNRTLDRAIATAKKISKTAAERKDYTREDIHRNLIRQGKLKESDLDVFRKRVPSLNPPDKVSHVAEVARPQASATTTAPLCTPRAVAVAETTSSKVDRPYDRLLPSTRSRSSSHTVSSVRTAPVAASDTSLSSRSTGTRGTTSIATAKTPTVPNAAVHIDKTPYRQGREGVVSGAESARRAAVLATAGKGTPIKVPSPATPALSTFKSTPSLQTKGDLKLVVNSRPRPPMPRFPTSMENRDTISGARPPTDEPSSDKAAVSVSFSASRSRGGVSSRETASSVTDRQSSGNAISGHSSANALATKEFQSGTKIAQPSKEATSAPRNVVKPLVSWKDSAPSERVHEIAATTSQVRRQRDVLSAQSSNARGSSGSKLVAAPRKAEKPKPLPPFTPDSASKFSSSAVPDQVKLQSTTDIQMGTTPSQQQNMVNRNRSTHADGPSSVKQHKGVTSVPSARSSVVSYATMIVDPTTPKGPAIPLTSVPGTPEVTSPLANFFAASVVGSSASFVESEDEYESPFGRTKVLPALRSLSGPKVDPLGTLQSASLSQVDVMKPNLIRNRSVSSFRGSVVSKKTSVVLSLSEETLSNPFATPRDYVFTNLPNASDSTLSTSRGPSRTSVHTRAGSAATLTEAAPHAKSQKSDKPAGLTDDPPPYSLPARYQNYAMADCGDRKLPPAVMLLRSIQTPSNLPPDDEQAVARERVSDKIYTFWHNYDKTWRKAEDQRQDAKKKRNDRIRKIFGLKPKNDNVYSSSPP